MSTSRSRVFLHVLGALLMAILPSIVLANRPHLSRKKMRSVHEQIELYGSRE
ncbi:MAG TPA: hypothetical protein PKL78_02445 [Anaerolineales bacterium]|nr:hypothetical protein [Anaerolineales bacterium]HNN12389.1 hypothetical protein [Anaerolineales bacterium]